MIELGRTIEALEHCSKIDKPECENCPMDGPGFFFACQDSLMRSALHWLKLMPQYLWERDVALDQLRSIGKELGQTMDDVRIVPNGGIKYE